MNINTDQDIYPAVDELIAELRLAGQTRQADILHHRLHKVAWTSRSELFKELNDVLTKTLKLDGVFMPDLTRKQIERICTVINECLQKDKTERLNK